MLAHAHDCSYAANGWQQRHYQCYYDTNASVDEIEAFYARELQSRGWQGLSGVGAREAAWCKNGDLAVLHFEESLKAGYVYTLTMSRSSFPPNCVTP